MAARDPKRPCPYCHGPERERAAFGSGSATAKVRTGGGLALLCIRVFPIGATMPTYMKIPVSHCPACGRPLEAHSPSPAQARRP